MSMNDKPRNGRLSPPTSLLTRSNSDGMVLGHKRSASLGGTIPNAKTHDRMSLGSGGSSASLSSSKSLYSPTGGVLGQISGTSPSGSRRGSTKNSLWGSVKSKNVKTPQPIQALAMFEAIGRGLRECINVAEEDITNLKANIDCLSVSSAQQLKAAERYLKRVEFQLSKLEELFDQYDLQQKLRDGVRTMAYAYVLSPGKERNSALSNVRSGFKECSENMCAIEADLEQMMGTLTFQMKGIQGFARLCPGDVFEIGLKHGLQKWKTRGRVMKSGEQIWEHEQTMFKVLLTDVLVIKAVEVKGLGKNIVLGNRYCDIADLFSAHPQIMTVNLNSSGSLKLNLVVTWNPLHLIGDETLLMNAGSASSSSRPSPRPSRQYSGGNSPMSPSPSLNDPRDFQSYVNPTLCPVIINKVSNSSVQSPDRDGINHELHSNDASSCRDSNGYVTMAEINHHKLTLKINNDSVDSSAKSTSNLTEVIRNDSSRHHRANDERNRSTSPASCLSADTSSSLRGSGSHLNVITIPVLGTNSLQDVINSVISCLEDIQGQYPELQGLEFSLLELDEFLREKLKSRRASCASNISVSVESALECFDFLDTEEDSEYVTDERLCPESLCLEKMMDPGMTARTSDSGISSITQQLRETSTNGRYDDFRQSSFEQIELSLVTHLIYCQKLIESLGSFGPLKCQELIVLSKLKRQSAVVDRLLKLVKISNNDSNKIISGTKELRDCSEIQLLWEQCTEGGRPLCATADMLLWKFQEIVDGVLSQSNRQSLSDEVAKMLVTRIMDSAEFENESVVTVFQFHAYFVVNRPLHQHLGSLADEVSILNGLKSGDSNTLRVTVHNLSKDVLPSSEILKTLALLLSRIVESKELIESYFEDLSQTECFRKEVSLLYVEMLESNDEDVRDAACRALKYFKPYDYVEQLAYVVQTDASSVVRKHAKTALLGLGEAGRQALEVNYTGEPDFMAVTML